MVKSVFSQVHQCKLHSEHYYITLINVVHINNKIYILTPYSGYFGKIPGILGCRIIKICANIKLNKVVYIKLQINLSISTFLLKYIKNRVLLYFHSSKIEKAVLLLLLE